MRIAGFALTGIVWLFAAEVHRTNAQPLAFEVATVKPRDLNRPGVPYRIGPDTLSMSSRLKDLIQFAYDVEDYQVAGGPAWVQSEFYDVQGKAASVSTPRQMKSMLQALVAERFQLKLNRQTKIMAGYALTVDKGGP